MTMQTNPIPRSLERLQGGHEDSDIVGSVEGRVELGGQEHFYWEPHTALVIPGERKELVVHYTTQVPNFVKTTQVPISQFWINLQSVFFITDVENSMNSTLFLCPRIGQRNPA